jgi:Spy/CpxP family protein refolding chaperone
MKTETRRKHWERMGQMHDEEDKLAAQLDADAPDFAAIGTQYQRIQKLQRQMLGSSIDTRNRMQAVVIGEQKGKLRRHSYMWG